MSRKRPELGGGSKSDAKPLNKQMRRSSASSPAKNLRKGAVYFDVRADEFMGIPMNIFDLVDSVLNIVALTNSEATSSEAR
jgi:hypothetical protein